MKPLSKPRRETEADPEKASRADEPILPGYRTRILDGNVLTGTDHRLGALRQWLNACLPGKSLVILEPDLGLISDLVLCEDAYTQERALLEYILDRVQPRDLLVFDRNFTTRGFAFGIARRGAFFIGRQHKINLPVTPVSKMVKCGTTETGTIYEQTVQATDPETGATLLLRRIEIRLFEKTRAGERVIGLLTNLPDTVPAMRRRGELSQAMDHRDAISAPDRLRCTAKCQDWGSRRRRCSPSGCRWWPATRWRSVRGSITSSGPREGSRGLKVSGHTISRMRVSAEYRTLAKIHFAQTCGYGWRELGSGRNGRLAH